MATALAAVACASALATVPLVRASEQMLDAGLRVTAVALVLLAAALLGGWPRLLPVPLVALAGVYGAQLAVDDVPLDVVAAVFAAGLLVTAELAYWSLEERAAIRFEEGESLRRVVFVSLLGTLSLLACLVVVALVDPLRARGLVVDLAGAAAAAAALVAVALSARGRGSTSHEAARGRPQVSRRR